MTSLAEMNTAVDGRPADPAPRLPVGLATVALVPGDELVAPPQETVWVRAARRAIEVAIALVGLFGLILAMPVIALAIRLDSPGPALFRQRRIGQDGRPFTIYKLRTMVRDAELLRDRVLPLNVMNGLTFKAPEDPRRTRVGRWLRRLSLDEAPQFWNVLRGDMALVGPRPPLPCEYERFTPRERCRLLVKPGITGMWQVAGRNLLEHRHMVELDLEYVAHRSLRLDLAIILRTLPAMVRGRGAY